MSTASTAPMESKSARKRKVKAEATATAASPAGRDSPAPESVNGHMAESVNGTESSYLKELAKNIRNLHKKLSGSVKADAVVEQNPGISIDDLVAQKKLNNDQKAQLMKKPQLQAQLAQLEDQHKHYMQFAQDLQEKHDKEKAALVESHSAELAQAKQEAADAATAAAAAAPTTVAPPAEDIEKGLAVITGFLHAAAAKRQSDDAESEEARAFEGALLLVYQGNSQSLNTLKSLVEGTEDNVVDVEGNTLEYTFAQIKSVALTDAGALVEDVEANNVAPEAEPEPAPEAASDPTSDPTIANAGLTELEDTNTIPIVGNGDAEPEVVLPEQTSAGGEAANAVAEAAWDPQASEISTQTATGEDWVQVPRDPAETETPNAAPAAQQSTTNWADESAAEEGIAEVRVAEANDGFEQVRRERGRGRGRGGRGFDGRGRGRGRGEYRGRGQGRGGRGAPRGDRPPQAA